MSTGKIVGLGIGVLALVVGIWFFSSYISVTNDDAGLRNAFKQKSTERTAFYDELWKTISQKAQISGRNDSSFQNVVKLQMSGQAEASKGAMMAWLQHSNPTASFDKVSSMYADLSRYIEDGRGQFFRQEKMMQDIKLQEDNLRTATLVGRIFLGNLKELDYKPITSTRTDNAIQTGKDDDTKVF